VLTVNLINIDGHIDLNEKSFNKSFKKPITLVFNFLEVIFFILKMFTYLMKTTLKKCFFLNYE